MLLIQGSRPVVWTYIVALLIAAMVIGILVGPSAVWLAIVVAVVITAMAQLARRALSILQFLTTLGGCVLGTLVAITYAVYYWSFEFQATETVAPAGLFGNPEALIGLAALFGIWALCQGALFRHPAQFREFVDQDRQRWTFAKENGLMANASQEAVVVCLSLLWTGGLLSKFPPQAGEAFIFAFWHQAATAVSAVVIGVAATLATGDGRNVGSMLAFAFRWGWTPLAWYPIVCNLAASPVLSLAAAAFWLSIFVVYVQKWQRRRRFQKQWGWRVFI